MKLIPINLSPPLQTVLLRDAKAAGRTYEDHVNHLLSGLMERPPAREEVRAFRRRQSFDQILGSVEHALGIMRNAQQEVDRWHQHMIDFRDERPEAKAALDPMAAMEARLDAARGDAAIDPPAPKPARVRKTTRKPEVAK